MIFETVIQTDLRAEEIGKTLAEADCDEQCDFLYAFLEATEEDDYNWCSQAYYIAERLKHAYTDDVRGRMQLMFEKLVDHLKDFDE